MDQESSDQRPRARSRPGLWALALLITLTALVYQRSVGPTRPVRGQVEVGGASVRYQLKRSAGGTGPYVFRVRVPDASFGGTIRYRRHPTDEPWRDLPLQLAPRPKGGWVLTGSVPRQPPGGKIAYQVFLRRGLQPEVSLPPAGPLVLRFRGHVPRLLLVPHVILMFLGMLFSNRAGLEAMRRDGVPARLAQVSLVLIGVGGLIFGPLVQWNAFGDAWTGVPFGWDLTDNKTLISFVGWLLAFAAIRRHAGRPGSASVRRWVLGAAILTFVVFSIPHSVMGTELDYETGRRIVVP